jgi:predicted secreted protein
MVMAMSTRVTRAFKLDSSDEKSTVGSARKTLTESSYDYKAGQLPCPRMELVLSWVFVLMMAMDQIRHVRLLRQRYVQTM